MNDRQTQIDFIRTSGWGYLMGVIDDEPYVTHLRFLVTGATAKRNSSHTWHAPTRIGRVCQRQTSTRRLSGPHTYITPSWYNTDKAAPRGTIQRACLRHARRHRAIRKPSMPASKTCEPLRSAVRYAVAELEDMDTNFIDGMLRAIVSFEIRIERIQCKFKLNQNRPAEDQQRAVDALRSSTDAIKAVAELMKTHVLETAE